jgi:hypothetical protein
MFLLRQPLVQPLIRRRHCHHEHISLVFADFDQLRHGLRWHGPQAHQESFIRRRLPAHQQMHRHVAAGVRLPRTIALDAFPREQLD